MRDVATTRWDPLRDLLALHEQIGPLVGTDAPGWSPPVDLYETSAAFVLTVEVPGLSRHDFDVHAEAQRVVVRGERPHAQVPCEQFHRVERGHGAFQRMFALPEPIDVARVSADLQDGVLTILLPKASPGGTHKISIT